MKPRPPLPEVCAIIGLPIPNSNPLSPLTTSLGLEDYLEAIDEYIARSRGWTKLEPALHYMADDPNPLNLWQQHAEVALYEECPKHTQDLNIIHEAEQELFDILVEHQHWLQLSEVMGLTRSLRCGHWIATAREHSEALVLTFEKHRQAQKQKTCQ